MEQLRERENGEIHGNLRQEASWPLVRAGHDELPPDEGRWLYVVDTTTADEEGCTPGAWVSAELDPEQTVLLLSPVFGRLVSRHELAVVDQLGCEAMVDEDYFMPGEALQ